MILVQMYKIFRLLIGVPEYSISSESYGGKQKNVENDGHFNKQLFIIYNIPGHLNKQLPGMIYIKYATKCQMISVVQMCNIFRLYGGKNVNNKRKY